MKTIDAQAEAAARKAEAPKGQKLYLSVNAPIDAVDEAEPGSHLKRIFVLLLLVHVFLVGGIILYNCLKQQSRPQIVEATAPEKKPVTARTLNTGATARPARVAVPTAASGEEYIIKVGDTLKGISETNNVDEAELCAVNGISPSAALEPGNVLRFPKKPTPAPAKAPDALVAANAPAALKTGTMKAAGTTEAAKQDTAAQAMLVKHEVSPDAPPAPAKTVILNAPPAPSAQDHPPGPQTGSQQVAGSAPPKPQAKPAEKPVVKAKEESKPKVIKEEPPKPEKSPAKGRTYMVNPKDTFYSISKRFGVNVNELMKLNNVKDPSKLHEGTKLKIPGKAE